MTAAVGAHRQIGGQEKGRPEAAQQGSVGVRYRRVFGLRSRCRSHSRAGKAACLILRPRRGRLLQSLTNLHRSIVGRQHAVGHD